MIGSGPAGQKGALSAAKLGKRVAIVDRKARIGGACLHSATIPSKTLREAILYLSGFRQRSFYGRDYALKDTISVDDLSFRVQTVLSREQEVVRAQLKRNGVALIDGMARFLDPHSIEVEPPDGHERVEAGHVLIACGTRPARDPAIPFDGERVLDTDQLPRGGSLPREMIVVGAGAGVVGVEYASMFTALGIRVTLIEQRPAFLEFGDREIRDALTYCMRERGTVFRLEERVTSVRVDGSGRVVAALESGKEVHGDVLLHAVGRQGNADRLNLQAAGRCRRARAHRHGRELPHRGPAHLCGGRCDRLSSARLDLDGAGTPGELPHVRRALPAPSGSAPVRDLHDSGDLHGRPDRAGSDSGPCSVRGRQSSLR